MKNYFSKMHTWLRFLMLMFVCVAWAGPTYAQDPDATFDFKDVHNSQQVDYTVNGITANYDSRWATYGADLWYNSGKDNGLTFSCNTKKIIRIEFSQSWINGLLLASVGEVTDQDMSNTATWEGEANMVSFHAPSGGDYGIHIAKVYLEGNSGSGNDTPGSDPEPEPEPTPSLNGTPQLVSLPYDNTFDTDADIENLLAIDNNADGNTFSAADGVVSISMSPNGIENNDFLVICKANLIANKKYNLSFDAKSTVYSAWHYYGVYVGTEPTASSLTSLINSNSWASVWTTDWESQTVTEFSVDADGTYYFAINYHAYSGSASMLIDNFHLETAPVDMPAAVDEVTVEPDDAGELSATISFTMPTANYGGDEYSDDKQLTYHIYRCQSGWGELGVGDVEIASGNAIAGSDVEYVDEAATNGQNYYAVVITDGALTSRVARGSAYVGADIPESPSNVQMSVNGNRVTLTWNAPERGRNDGFIGTPTYDVYPYINYSEGSVINDSPITETTYSFDYDMNSGEQGDVKFSVKAVTTGGSSYSAYTPNSISVGAPYALPYTENFSESNNRYKFETSTGSGYGQRWDNQSYMSGYSNGSAVQFQTGKIAFAGSNALLSFDYKTDDAPAITFDVVVRDNNGAETVAKTISNPTNSYQTANVILSGAYKDATWVNVIIRANFPTAYQYAYLDNISIIAKAQTYAVTVSPSIANGIVTADKDEAEAGETVTLTATPAAGYLFGSWSVTTTANGTPVAVANNQFTMPAEAVTVSATFDQKPPIIDNYSNTLATQDLFDEFTVINANGDEKTWFFDGNYAQIEYNGSQAMNDYLVTPGITITGGNYRLSVDMKGYYSSGANFEKFEIVYGTAPTADALITPIVGETIPPAAFQSYSQELEISTPGIYYFAIRGISDKNMWYLYAKNFVLEMAAPTYAVTIGSHDNGTLSTDVTEAEEGATVNVTATPNEGYELTSITVNGEAIVGTSFTMPAEDVTVAAVFTAINYTISVSNAIANGSVEVEGDVTTATAGTVITLVPSAEDGYVFKSWNVRRDDTQATIPVANNQFTMPAANVTISATFGEPSLEYDWSNIIPLTLIAHNSDGYWATFSSTSDVVFFNGDVEDVYAVTLEGDVITLSRYDQFIPVGAGGLEGIHVPANTGVLIKAASANSAYVPVTNYHFGEAPANLLHPSTESMAPMAGTHKFYKLAYSDYLTEENLGFYYGAENGGVYTVRNGAAYLAVPNSAAASVLHGFSFEDIENGFTTSLKAIESLNAAEQGVYTLDGRKVSEGQIGKGAYIVNGKKVINF